MNDQKAQKFILTIIVTTLLLFLMPAALVVTVDPYAYFHKPFHTKTLTYSGTSRYQNAGLINSLLANPDGKIDSILLGTSLSENFPTSEMKNKDGVPILKLTVAGSKPGEQNVIFEKALRTGRVRHVVWEISSEYSRSELNVTSPETEFPFFLYSRNIFDQAKYVFNNDVVERAFGLLKGKTKGRQALNELYTWDSVESFSAFSSSANLKKLAKDLQTNHHVLGIELYDADKISFINIDKYVLPYLRNNPDIEFELYFPPVSYYQYALLGTEGFAREMDMREYIIRSSADMKNVKIYEFDMTEGIGNDLSNYRDTAHYKPVINALIAKDMVRNKHQITLQAWPAYKTGLILKINNYSADFLKRQIQKTKVQ